ncbi:hypothetical protein [Novosphingobium lentum]|uniref:hypothetical protein n=1 Tax=Novosphingobium lentum TaxID=145287 RepID=UPI000A8738B8|nr:hypothetical protein [Novosphingobium lentum]
MRALLSPAGQTPAGSGFSEPRTAGLTREERIALVVAIAAHVALAVALTMGAPGRKPVPLPERMTVTFSDQVALQSTSPEPQAQAAPEVAPDRGEAQSAPQPEPLPVVQPQPQPPPQPMPQPAPRVEPAPVPQPRPIARPAPRAVARPVERPAPPVAAPRPQPHPAAKPAPAKPAARPSDDRPRRRPDAPEGASRVGNDFLKGIPGSQAAGASRNPPAATIGPQVAASLRGAVSRQLKPHWVAPQGVDADKLVTVLAWDLNPDGSLAGRPRVVSQDGINDANRPQAARHAEQAIRAVQLAAPFDLPAEFYSGWKHVAAFRFDRKLSQ